MIDFPISDADEEIQQGRQFRWNYLVAVAKDEDASPCDHSCITYYRWSTMALCTETVVWKFFESTDSWVDMAKHEALNDLTIASAGNGLDERRSYLLKCSESAVLTR